MSRKTAQIIALSFKKTEKDIKLYKYLNSFEDKSVEIKRLVKLALKVENVDYEKNEQGVKDYE